MNRFVVVFSIFITPTLACLGGGGACCPPSAPSCAPSLPPCGASSYGGAGGGCGAGGGIGCLAGGGGFVAPAAIPPAIPPAPHPPFIPYAGGGGYGGNIGQGSSYEAQRPVPIPQQHISLPRPQVPQNIPNVPQGPPPNIEAPSQPLPPLPPPPPAPEPGQSYRESDRGPTNFVPPSVPEQSYREDGGAPVNRPAPPVPVQGGEVYDEINNDHQESVQGPNEGIINTYENNQGSQNQGNNLNIQESNGPIPAPSQETSANQIYQPIAPAPESGYQDISALPSSNFQESNLPPQPQQPVEAQPLPPQQPVEAQPLPPQLPVEPLPPQLPVEPLPLPPQQPETSQVPLPQSQQLPSQEVAPSSSGGGGLIGYEEQISGTGTGSQEVGEDIGCNDTQLRSIVEEALNTNPDNLDAARAIEWAASKRFGGRFNSIVSDAEFAYVNWYGKRNCQLRVRNRHSLTWED